MAEKDIIDMLFEKKEEEDAFEMRDKLLKEHRNNIYKASNELYGFIDAKISNENREELKKLISNRNDALSDAFYREGQLFYRNGIIDGLYLKSLNLNKE